MIVDASGKARDKAKLARKKARSGDAKAAWRERFGLESDDAALIARAFAAAADGRRAPTANPFAGLAGRFVGRRKPELKVGEALAHASVRGGLLGDRWHGPLAAVASWRWRFRRPITEWGGGSFSSLLRHVFAEYDVPAFLDPVFAAAAAKPRDPRQQWFLDVAQGDNLRHCPSLPFSLTSRTAHFVVNAPPDLRLAAAFRWGQVRGLGGDEQLADAVAFTAVADRFGDAAEEQFWADVLGLLAREPMLGTDEVGPLIDYLQWAKYARFGRPSLPEEADDLGTAVPPDEGEVPPQPTLCVRRRAVRTLMRDCQRWHDEQVNFSTDAAPATWPGFGLDLELADGAAVWEITTSTDLRAEGRALGHCVGGYVHQCAARQAIILSYRPNGEAVDGRLTLHVVPSMMQLAEARGRFNRLPTDAEWRQLTIWAGRANVTIPPHLRRVR
jgi:hypothetical protein